MSSWHGPIAVFVAIVVAGLGGWLLLRGDDGSQSQPAELGGEDGSGRASFDVESFDPFAWKPERDRDLLERGADGLAHVLYVKSPGGVGQTAERTLRFEDEIKAAAERHGVDARTLEALIFLESAGRVDVIAGEDPEAAVGLGQILPGTATDLLGMEVDLERSKQLTRSIARNQKRANTSESEEKRRKAGRAAIRAQAERREIDERFDPEQAIDGAARYLAIAKKRFGSDDLAATSYHMGIGNLEHVIETYVSPRPLRGSTRETVRAYGITWPRLYFDSSPKDNPETDKTLKQFADDSRFYTFRLEAAREILRLYREDSEELDHLNELQNTKASAEEVLRPREDNEPYEDAGDLQAAYDDGELVPLPDDAARLGFRIDPKMGEFAPRLDQKPSLYRGLRPDALATLLFIAKELRRLSGDDARLRVTSTVRDQDYQDLLVGANNQATSDFSLHTAGYAFDITAAFRSKRRRAALIHILERLRAQRVLDYVFEPGAIHVTAGPDAERLLPMLETVRTRQP